MVILARLTLIITAILLSLLVPQGSTQSDSKTMSELELLIESEPYLPQPRPQSRSRRTVGEHIFFYNYNLMCKIKPVKISYSCLTNTFFDCFDKNCGYRKDKSVIFLVHGFKNDYKSAMNRLIKDAILNKTGNDLNIFVVDWSYYANGIYILAQDDVDKVGKTLGNLIVILITKHGVSPRQVKLIGHSLGAHVAGIAGNTVYQAHRKVDYIVGLDPAWPIIAWIHKRNELLNRNSADFVHIIHTSTLFLGMSEAMGHVDYYPNGGVTQPGCIFRKQKWQRKQWTINDIVDWLSCSHSRAYKYYAESIRSGGFYARKCFDWNSFYKGECSKNSYSMLPGLDVDRKANGTYYLNVNSKEPFAKGKKGMRMQNKTSPKKNIKAKLKRQRNTSFRKKQNKVSLKN